MKAKTIINSKKTSKIVSFQININVMHLGSKIKHFHVYECLYIDNRLNKS